MLLRLLSHGSDLLDPTKVRSGYPDMPRCSIERTSLDQQHQVLAAIRTVVCRLPRCIPLRYGLGVMMEEYPMFSYNVQLTSCRPVPCAATNVKWHKDHHMADANQPLPNHLALPNKEELMDQVMGRLVTQLLS